MEEGAEGFSDGGVVADVEAEEVGGDGVENDELAIGKSGEGLFKILISLATKEAIGIGGGFAGVEFVGEEVDFGEVGAVGEEPGANDLGGIVFAGNDDDGCGAARKWKVESGK